MTMPLNRPAIRGTRGALALTLAVIAVMALWFVIKNVGTYLHYDAMTYDDFWPRRGGFIPHMAGGVVAILTGVIQIWLGATGRTGKVHCVLGRFYVGGVAVGAAGAVYLALTISAGGFAYAAGLFSLAVAWMLTTAMAIVAIKRRAVQQHREWMIRSYIVTFAFVTFRFGAHMLVGWKIAPAPAIGTFMAFACWSVPLLIAEPFLQFGKLRPGN